jgi:PBP1b-binding outer membrane lipoprotein LpoB
MRTTLTALIVASVLANGLLLSGCTQFPTEKQSVSDMRPQISFKAQSEFAQGARVLVDGLDLGSVGDFLDGIASVRVLSGMHKLTVTSGATVLLDEKVYLGDGVSRSFIVK